MSLKERIDADLKSAMLAGDKTLVTTLRGLKSSILYAEVAANKREKGLTDQEVIEVLKKEAKKRKESAELYSKGGSQEKADAENDELEVITEYLPEQISDEELDLIVDKAVAELGEVTTQTMGKIIGKVKELSQGRADGGQIAAKVKGKIKS